MGNFNALIAEIDRRRHNRAVLGAIGIVWSLFFTVILATTGLQA